MRYREILESDMSVDEFRELLDKCTQAISVYKEVKSYLYRGTGRTEVIFQGKSPEGRSPRDTPIEIHNAVEGWMAAHNFTARRSNTIFTTSDFRHAKWYTNGIPYIIIPYDGFSFSWWQNAKELTPFVEQVALQNGYMMDDDGFFKYFTDNLDTIITTMTPRRDDFASAVLSKNEVMIHGSYLAVQYDEWGTDKPYRRILREITGV